MAIFLVFCLNLFGCGNNSSGNSLPAPTITTSELWNMPVYQGTEIDPTSGLYQLIYTFQGRTGMMDFEVSIDNGVKYMRHRADNGRMDIFPIRNGSFYFEWGEIGQWHPESNHPTDSYAISGAFVDQTHAIGKIKNAYAGAITNESDYTMEHLPTY